MNKTIRFGWMLIGLAIGLTVVLPFLIEAFLKIAALIVLVFIGMVVYRIIKHHFP
ncbi:hypothetical protein RAJCM14343_3941 [Rhodococcus aetherivorans]|uniref:Uncharacterized protein n=1 Tax=Rhodococcus aetherivorans TaxID=191292 RepID=A0ABQ0YQ02_9NOCA|nr:hypothetical protein [Rhodococcus aetherivorans]ETT25278.1 hypothetical protein RR21198_4018 [Rhodococcus rhodochrous ATCC 21198]NGP28449.1 hypothetical protein [Rhodococcus aetherivorans]GES38676.1 hypothetical protein RAJCM14343_3941 [Rhodococcus aetherivorans]